MQVAPSEFWFGRGVLDHYCNPSVLLLTSANGSILVS